MPSTDFIVVGLGVTGSAIAWQLARAGQSVLGLDRFQPPHDLGSSHGETRIIREAYFEHPQYVPFVQRAYTAWAEVERLTGRELLRTTGGLMLGPREGMLVAGALASARTHKLEHQELSPADLRRRFPQLHLNSEDIGIWEPRAGFLEPEKCVQTLLDLARDASAELRLDEQVIEWTAARDGVEVRTPLGIYAAKQLVLAAGPWIGDLLTDLAPPLVVERTVQHWFRPRAHPERFTPEHLPIFVAEYAPDLLWYGFPALPVLGEGIKIALHYQGVPTTADGIDRTVAPEEIERVRRIMERHLPDANGEHLRSSVCMYTNTPDKHFLIDRYPDQRNVWLVSPCSGHGFKFAPVIGEVVRDLALTESSSFDLSPFCWKRFADRQDAPRSNTVDFPWKPL